MGQIFSSAAKTEILRALHHQPDPLGLRPLARIADLHVRSAELALTDLVREKLIIRKRTPTRVYYALNRTHPSAPVVAAAFDAAAAAAIHRDSRALNRRATRILPLMRQASRMLRRARKSCHVA